MERALRIVKYFYNFCPHSHTQTTFQLLAQLYPVVALYFIPSSWALKKAGLDCDDDDHHQHDAVYQVAWLLKRTLGWMDPLLPLSLFFFSFAADTKYMIFCKSPVKKTSIDRELNWNIHSSYSIPKQMYLLHLLV